jgi:hypothetical protein
MRQTAVYHKFFPQIGTSEAVETAPGYVSTLQSKSMFVLIAPSANVEWQFKNCLQESSKEELSPLSPWNIHRILFAGSLQGWMDYGRFERTVKAPSKSF